MFQKTDKTTASRYSNQRMHYAEDVVFPILDVALFCTVSYSINNQVFSIPTSFVREGRKLYIHGSVGSHFINNLLRADSVCISVMIADDIVVAKSAYNHSVNYRSVIIFSKATLIEGHHEKTSFFKSLTEKFVPSSWGYLRAMKDSEVKKTSLVCFDIEEASAKVRSGMPSDVEEDEELPIWSGLIPIGSVRGVPIPSPQSLDIPMPEHLK